MALAVRCFTFASKVPQTFFRPHSGLFSRTSQGVPALPLQLAAPFAHIASRPSKAGQGRTGINNFTRIIPGTIATLCRNIVSMADSGTAPSRGALIVLEGLDRSGKSTQVQRLVEYLQGRGVAAEAWRFPDRSTAMGQMISSYLESKSELDDYVVHLLFSANRWEKRSLMESKLRAGVSLIVDRYSYSGVAFTAAKGLPFDWCKAPEVGLPAPDAVLFLQIPPEAALERGGYGEERYEKLEFQNEVAAKYDQLRDATWQNIDARGDADAVQAVLRPIVDQVVVHCQEGKSLGRLWP